MTTTSEKLPVETTWQRICRLDALFPDRGAAALVDGVQVALFVLRDTGDVHAVSHRDPSTGANVMARGLVGSRGDVATVASPLHKQVYDLATGVCLDDPSLVLTVWPTRVVDGFIELGPPGAPQ